MSGGLTFVFTYGVYQGSTRGSTTGLSITSNFVWNWNRVEAGQYGMQLAMSVRCVRDFKSAL